MYKTTFSSQAKDVRRAGKPLDVDKENLPKGFDVTNNQPQVRRQFTRKSRIGSVGKKPIDMVIAGFRRCFKDSEEGQLACGPECDQVVSDAEQIDMLCTEIASLKASSDMDDVEHGAEKSFILQQQLQQGGVIAELSATAEGRSCPLVQKKNVQSRSRSPTNSSPSPTSSGRTSPTCPPLHFPLRRDSPSRASPRALAAEELRRGGRSSPRVPPTANRSKASPPADRTSPTRQRAVASSGRSDGPPQSPTDVPPKVALAISAVKNEVPAEGETSRKQLHPAEHPVVDNTQGVPVLALSPQKPSANGRKSPREAVQVQVEGAKQRTTLTEALLSAAGDGSAASLADAATQPNEVDSNSDDSSSSSDGLEGPDSRKRKVTGEVEQPRRSRRLREIMPSPPRRSTVISPTSDDTLPEYLVNIPRSPPSPCANDFGSCPSPPLVGPYSPPAARQRRYSLSTPPSPIPQLCLSAFPQNLAAERRSSDVDARRLAEHEEWLQAQLQLYSSCVPNRSGANDPDLGDCDVSDEESDAEAGATSPSAAGSTTPVVTTRYFLDLCARFEECKRLNHLPTLNLFFTLLDTILLLGNKKSLQVLLRRNNLPKLLAAMQFNPKLNALVHKRPHYLSTMGKRQVAIPLPASIAEMATTLYQLLFLKDTIIPVVCDETRYLNLNVHILRMKGKLCQTVFDDRRLLPQLFNDLRSTMPNTQARLDSLRFLKEFLELGITSYPGDGAFFWRGILRDHQLVPLLTELLGDRDHPVRRAAIDIALLLCDEESRKILHGIIPHHPLFLRRLFDVFCDMDAPEATVLQLQATLPMLVASPNMEALPVFYDAAQHVLLTWLEEFQAGGGIPPPAHISAFMELLSLAVHHHHRTFQYSHDGCVMRLIDFTAILWCECPGVSHSVLVAANKGILSILHVTNEAFHQHLARQGVFKGMVQKFADGNNLITSSMLTLLHTVLQLEIQPLIRHVCSLWFSGHGPPAYKSMSFVQQLFFERHRAVPPSSIYT
eukprot:GGOE01002345.1.p1 GENE.GGOE01002345.1~~GGOE01002345.1.p1  ORF type:complete len:1044 (-),score=211.40 GGOE01002345.1:409-3420(-)